MHDDRIHSFAYCYSFGKLQTKSVRKTGPMLQAVLALSETVRLSFLHMFFFATVHRPLSQIHRLHRLFPWRSLLTFPVEGLLNVFEYYMKPRKQQTFLKVGTDHEKSSIGMLNECYKFDSDCELND